VNRFMAIKGTRMGRARPRARARLAVGAVAASMLLSGAAVAAGSIPAQAASCATVHAGTLIGDVSKVSFVFNTNCSDGLMHLTGTLYDTKCDSREAKVAFDLYTVQQVGGTIYDWEVTAHNDNGCGNYSTFNLSAQAPYLIFGDTWKLTTCTWAENAFGGSRLICANTYE
jgi:hypothetical protein